MYLCIYQYAFCSYFQVYKRLGNDSEAWNEKENNVVRMLAVSPDVQWLIVVHVYYIVEQVLLSQFFYLPGDNNCQDNLRTP